MTVWLPPWKQIEAQFPGWTVQPPVWPSGIWTADWESEDHRTSYMLWRRTAADLTTRLREITSNRPGPGQRSNHPGAKAGMGPIGR